MSGNNISIVGNIGTVGEVRHTPSGDPVINITVAVNRGKDKNGDKITPDWFDVPIWGAKAENIAPYLKVGGLVFVSGEAALIVNENKGKTYSKISIRFAQVTLLSSGNVENEDADAALVRGKTQKAASGRDYGF